MRDNTDTAHPIGYPIDCLELLVNHTPAQMYLASLEVEVKSPQMDGFTDGRLLRALQNAKGLRSLELFTTVAVKGILAFVFELDHVRTIRILAWEALKERQEKHQIDMSERNSNWAKRHEAVESI